jgi:hypothetical protein
MEPENTSELPTKLSKEDALTIELASVYVQNARLQLAASEAALEKTQKELQAKYSLGPQDRLDVRTLEITRV